MKIKYIAHKFLLLGFTYQWRRYRVYPNIYHRYNNTKQKPKKVLFSQSSMDAFNDCGQVKSLEERKKLLQKIQLEKISIEINPNNSRTKKGIKMKKILHIPKYYPPHRGGIEDVCYNIVSGLIGKYEQMVFCFNSNKHTIQEFCDGIYVVRNGFFLKIASQALAFSYFF